ncbi:hypothetical protein J7J83_03560 [bacterium]|nr:hypothetical protein [bacterium]
MADDNNPIIDLSGKNNTKDNNILSLEDELLGSKPSSANNSIGTTGTTKPQITKNKFNIPQAVKDKYPELIPLILQTESMNDEEREYWFQILPIMTTDQVNKFRKILVTEKQQLSKLDQDYEKELSKINEKHLQEWQSFESKEARDKIAKEEEVAEKEESSEEEDLLKKLQNL